MSKYLLWPKCGGRLFLYSWYSFSKKFATFADGTFSKRSIETSPYGPMEINTLICDAFKAEFDQ